MFFLLLLGSVGGFIFGLLVFEYQCSFYSAQTEARMHKNHIAVKGDGSSAFPGVKQYSAEQLKDPGSFFSEMSSEVFIIFLLVTDVYNIVCWLFLFIYYFFYYYYLQNFVDYLPKRLSSNRKQ